MGIAALGIATFGVGSLVAGGATLGAAITEGVLVGLGSLAIPLSTLGGAGILALSLGAVPTPLSIDDTGANARGTAAFDPNALGAFVFGTTTVPSSLIFEEVHGTDDTEVSNILAHAWHEIESYVSLTVDAELVSFSGDAATGDYAGILTWTRRQGAPSQTAIPLAATTWPATTPTFEGVAHSSMTWDFKNQDKLKGGVPTRLDIIVQGALLYDPRNDTTAGGSGAERIADPTTWTFQDGNAALVLLRVLIGEYTAGGELLWGRGAAQGDIDLASFIAMANIADEVLDSLPRFKLGGWWAIDGNWENFVERWEAETGGKLAKPAGIYTVWLPNDDLTSLSTITDDDILEGQAIELQVGIDLGRVYNTARGRYIEPDQGYRGFQYPEVTEPTAVTEDGGKRVLAQDFSWVQEVTIAERIVRMRIRRSRYPRVWTVPMGWPGQSSNYAPFTVHTLNCSETGDVAQLVRVVEQISAFNGATVLVLQEEAAAIYDDTLALGTPFVDNSVTNRLDRLGTVTPRYIDGTSIDDVDPTVVNIGPSANADPMFDTFGTPLEVWFTTAAATAWLSTDTDFSLASLADGEVGSSALRHNAATLSEGYSQLVGIDPNETYFLSCWVRGSVGTQDFRLGVNFYESDGTLIPFSTTDATGWTGTTNVHWAIANTAAPTSFTKYELTFGPTGAATMPVTPARAVFVQLVLRANVNSEAAENLDFQQFQLVRKDPVSPAQGGISIETSLPSLPDIQYPVGSLIYLTTNARLYKNVADAWIPEIPQDYGAAINDDPNFSDLQNWFGDAAQTLILATPFSLTAGPVSGAPTAGNVLTVTDNDDASEDFLSRRFPIDSDKTYRVTVRARQPTGDRRNYLLVNFYDDTGASITGAGGGATGWTSTGTFHYWSVADAVFPSSWTRYEFQFGPDADGGGTIPAGAVSCSIGALCTRDGAVGTNTTVNFQDYRLEEVVGGSLLAVDAVTANKILAGTITAAELAATITYTKELIISSAGELHSSGKDSFADTTAGFWLGHDGASSYDFVIGDAGESLSWDGSAGLLTVLGDLKWATLQTFTPGWTGFGTPPTGTVSYLDLGAWAIIAFHAQRSATSNSTSFTMTGIPTAIRPPTTSIIGGVPIIDNSVSQFGLASVAASGTAVFQVYNVVSGDVRQGAFGGTLTKGIRAGAVLVYPL